MEEIASAPSSNYDVLIAKRNQRWIERLKPSLTKGDAFIAVGVGHFTGNASLIKLLQEQGFKVTRVK